MREHILVNMPYMLWDVLRTLSLPGPNMIFLQDSKYWNSALPSFRLRKPHDLFQEIAANYGATGTYMHVIEKSRCTIWKYMIYRIQYTLYIYMCDQRYVKFRNLPKWYARFGSCLCDPMPPPKEISFKQKQERNFNAVNQQDIERNSKSLR